MQVNIRIRDELYKKLREVAENEQRTITAQLDIILCKALETYEKNDMETVRKPIETTKEVRRRIIGDDLPLIPTTPTTPTTFVPHNTPGGMQTNQTPQTPEIKSLKAKAEIWLETMNVSSKDVSETTFKELRDALYALSRREPFDVSAFNRSIFEEVQAERRENHAK